MMDLCRRSDARGRPNSEIPAHVLGLPSVALPTGVSYVLPTGIQIYADQWREDLCLEVAEIIEGGVDRPGPVDPLR